MVFPAELLAFAGFGAAILLVAWVPLWLERVPLTLPMLAVGVGFIAFVFTRDAASPLTHPRAAKLFPEVVLIVAVMGAIKAYKCMEVIGHQHPTQQCRSSSTGRWRKRAASRAGKRKIEKDATS